ncbi:hypothetical protein FB451DRAFT_1421762 [Mycena latifolia]|nr:hypothetical protein FB451DRAFT_1421762 [Mycena latifolia]
MTPGAERPRLCETGFRGFYPGRAGACLSAQTSPSNAVGSTLLANAGGCICAPSPPSTRTPSSLLQDHPHSPTVNGLEMGRDVLASIGRTLDVLDSKDGTRDGQPEREGVSAHDFRPREELTAIWMLAVSPYSPDLALCAAAGKGGAAPAPGLARCACAGKAHHKLLRESDDLCNSLCGLQALIYADRAAEGFYAACGVGGQAREGVG